MTNEEMQQRIEFIINQQAELTTKVDHFATKVDELAEIQAQAESNLSQKFEALVELQAHSEARLSRVEESFVLLVQMARITDERLDTLTGSQASLSRKLEELAELQKNSDERLNTLIQVVERYISERGNGKT